MRREVPTPLSNEKVTYIKFQGDLWVALTLGFSHSKVTFRFSHSKVTFCFSYSQSDPWNFSSLFNYNNKENTKTLHIPHFLDFTKIKYYLQYFTNYFTIIYNFHSPFFQKCFLHASCCVRIFSSLELKIWAFFTSRAMLHFLYSSMLITNLCTKAM